MGVSSSFIGASGQMGAAVVLNSALGNDIAIGGRVSIIPYSVDTVVQGTWASGASATSMVNVDCNNNASKALNDEIQFKVYLSAGTWTCRIMGTAGTDKAIWTVSIDGVSAGTQEWYQGAGAVNIIKNTTGIAIAANGLKTLDLKAASKNGASSGYGAEFQIIEFIRTA